MPRGRPPGAPPPPRIPPNEPITITVKFAFSGDTLASLHLRIGDRIGSLKRDLEKPCGVPHDYQQLLHHTSARELRDHEKLEVTTVNSCSEHHREGEVMLVFKRSEDGDSIQQACWNGNRWLVQVLVKTKADVNAPYTRSHGVVPLHVAACRGRKDIVDVLLSAAADPDIRDIHGLTALHAAASDDVARSLLDAKADALCMDSDCRRASTNIMPLFALSGDRAMVEFLLRNRAVANTPHEIYEVSSEYVFRIGSNLNHPTRDNPALHCAVIGGHEELVVLLAAVTDLSVRGRFGKSALQLACKSQRAGGSSVNAIVAEMRDPIIFRGISSGSPQASVLFTGIWSALMKEIRFKKKVCLHGQEVTVYDDRHRQFRSDLLCADARGFTLLHEACEGGNLNVVKWLLSRNADVHARNRLGASPLSLAIDTSVVTDRDRLSACKLLLDAGADVHQGVHGVTLLTKAVLAGSIRVADCLLQARADPTVSCQMFGTPLQAAEQKGWKPMIEFFKRVHRDRPADLGSTFGQSPRPRIRDNESWASWACNLVGCVSRP